MNEVNSVVSDSLSAIAAINEKVTRLVEEAKTERQKALEPFLEALAKSGEVSVIVVRGYTPGFNDGEPCEHSADFWVNIQELKDEDMLEDNGVVSLPEELAEGLQNETTWNPETRTIGTDSAISQQNSELCRQHGHVYESPSSETRAAIDTLVFMTAEEENETNYFVTYLLKDGKFEVTRGDYDCGY